MKLNKKQIQRRLLYLRYILLFFSILCEMFCHYCSALLHSPPPVPRPIVIDDSSWKNAAESFTVALTLTLGGYESAIAPIHLCFNSHLKTYVAFLSEAGKLIVFADSNKDTKYCSNKDSNDCLNMLSGGDLDMTCIHGSEDLAFSLSLLFPVA